MNSTKKIAALITCHNRREKTIQCLQSLFTASPQPGTALDVYLVDDGSTDGTGEAVKSRFPLVKIIQGDGSLFWNKGMRLAWETASKTRDYNFYLWLNDDTLLSPFALKELFECSREAVEKDGRPAVIVGACQSSTGSNQFSYGGRTDSGEVIPNGRLQTCKYINGNAVLVPEEIYEKVGILSPEYTHAMGDIDYGLRAIAAGYHCYTTKKYIAACPRHNGIPGWRNPEVPLAKRWELVHSPKGLNLPEYNTFRRKFRGNLWIVDALKVYLKVIFPATYSKISNKKIS